MTGSVDIAVSSRVQAVAEFMEAAFTHPLRRRLHIEDAITAVAHVGGDVLSEATPRRCNPLCRADRKTLLVKKGQVFPRATGYGAIPKPLVWKTSIGMPAHRAN